MDPEKIIVFFKKLEGLQRGRSLTVFLMITVGAVLLAFSYNLFKLAFPATGISLRRELLVFAGLVFFAGLSLLLFAAYLALKKAGPLPSGPRPRAIKGPGPFGSEDAELFQHAHREREITDLLALIRNERDSLVVLKGESGVGKTSLLMAGLVPRLREESPSRLAIYWEATPAEAGASLFRVLATGLNRKELATPSADFEGANSLFALWDTIDPDQEVTLILDQFEQLRPEEHKSIFDFLNHVCRQPAPHRHQCLVVFSQDYSSTWLDFADAQLESLPRIVSLYHFNKNQAREVASYLLQSANQNRSLDEDFLESLVNAVADGGSEISPADLAISLFMMDVRAERRSIKHFSKKHFEFFGSDVGLISEYIDNRLRVFAANPRSLREKAVLTALMPLLDRKTGRRRVEGISLTKMAKAAELKPEQLQPTLSFLASEHARILQETTRKGRRIYRLTHDRFVKPLLYMANIMEPEARHARLYFDRALRTWQQSNRRTVDLTYRQLRQVLNTRAYLSTSGEDEDRLAFLAACKKHWRMRWLLGLSLPLIILISMYIAGETYRTSQYRKMLATAGLPADLIDFRTQIDTLSLDHSLSDNRWLSKTKMRRLTIRLRRGRDLEHLPETLQVLELHDSDSTDLDRLFKLKRLKTLKLYGLKRVSDLQGIGQLANLETLHLHGMDQLISLAGIENLPQLKELSITDNPGLVDWRSLEQLASLQTLTIRGPSLKSAMPLKNLKRVESLSLESFEISDLMPLSGLARLEHLKLTRNPKLTRLPDFKNLSRLQTLEIAYLAKAQLTTISEAPIYELRLSNVTVDLALLAKSNLIRLDLTDVRDRSFGEIDSPARLPVNTDLKELTLRGFGSLGQLRGIEAFTGLRSLALIDNLNLRNLEGLEKLTDLNKLNLVAVPGLYNLEVLANMGDLQQLVLVRNPNLQQLNGLTGSNLTKLTLADNDRLVELANLERFMDLYTLDLQGDLPTLSLDGFGENGHLREFHWRYNSALSDTSFLVNLPKLVRCDLSDNNQLIRIQGLEVLSRLETLDVSQTALEGDLPGLARLTSLKELRLGGTRIEQLKGLPRSVRSLHFWRGPLPLPLP